MCGYMWCIGVWVWVVYGCVVYGCVSGGRSVKWDHETHLMRQHGSPQPLSELPCPYRHDPAPLWEQTPPGAPHLVDVELTLAPGQLPVAGSELSNEVVAAREDDAEAGDPGSECLSTSEPLPQPPRPHSARASTPRHREPNMGQETGGGGGGLSVTHGPRKPIGRRQRGPWRKEMQDGLDSYLNELARKGIWGQSQRSERWMAVKHYCSTCQVG